MAQVAHDAQLAKLAQLFASAIVRLRKQRVLEEANAKTREETFADSAKERLEVGNETVLSVHTG